MTTLIPHEYPALLGVLKERIRAAQYSALPNLQPLVGEVIWSKRLILLARCKMPLSARANSLHTAERIDVVAPQSVTNHAA